MSNSKHKSGPYLPNTAQVYIYIDTLHTLYIRIHIISMNITFTLHLHYIYITFTLHLHYIYITFALHLHYMPSPSPLHSTLPLPLTLHTQMY